MEYQKLPLESW